MKMFKKMFTAKTREDREDRATVLICVIIAPFIAWLCLSTPPQEWQQQLQQQQIQLLGNSE